MLIPLERVTSVGALSRGWCVPEYKQMVPNAHSPAFGAVGRGRADEPSKTRSRPGRLPGRLLVCVSSLVAATVGSSISAGRSAATSR
jgi:hypothetical protein